MDPLGIHKGPRLGGRCKRKNGRQIMDYGVPYVAADKLNEWTLAGGVDDCGGCVRSCATPWFIVELIVN